MRIYLTKRMKVGAIEYPSAGFYETPDELGVQWVEDGIAYNATDDNKVKAFVKGEMTAETVELESGQVIDQKYVSTIELARPPEPEPMPEPEPIVEEDTAEFEGLTEEELGPEPE